jgi:hypothetical protein
MRARVTEKREIAKGTLLDLSSWDGEAQPIAPELLRDHLSNDLRSYTYLVAGPPAAFVETLHAVTGVSEERVSPDRFSGYRQTHLVTPPL